MKNIKAIFFDLDGTLLQFEPVIEKVLWEYLRDQKKCELDEEDYRKLRKWTHWYFAGSDALLQNKDYSDSDGRFWFRFAERFVQQVDICKEQYQEWAEEINTFIIQKTEWNHYIMEDVLPTLSALREAGYKLAVITNRQEPVDYLLEEFLIKPLLDFYYHAGAVGYWKPDSRIFDEGLKTAGVKPDETLYVGDNYFADITGARNAGLTPILIDPDDVFMAEDCPVIHSIAELSHLL
ncbi:MAG: HAD family hydrolase [Anaerolineales bacterium]|nr:HAD family hydrolase [Anaerolineales bacterium]